MIEMVVDGTGMEAKWVRARDARLGFSRSEYFEVSAGQRQTGK